MLASCCNKQIPSFQQLNPAHIYFSLIQKLFLVSGGLRLTLQCLGFSICGPVI